MDVIERLHGATVGLVGDLVADLYVSGQSDRVSREAPVLVLQYEHEWLRPGGAANVAANIAALGATVRLIGIVGNDLPGQRLLAALHEIGEGRIQCQDSLIKSDRETITKTRFLAGAKLTSRQQVLRLDRQPATPPSDDLLSSLRQRVLEFDRFVDAWIVSDYGYGGTCEALRDQLREIAQRKPVVADSRYDIHLFRGMTVVKPNEEEAEAAARRLNLSLTGSSDGSSVSVVAAPRGGRSSPQREQGTVAAGHEGELATALAERLEAGAALVTLGNKGMVLGRRGAAVRIPAVGSGEIVDLTGAGDSVAATLAAALAAGADMETACRLANHAGAVVVMKEGAATVSPDELRASVLAHEPD